MSPDHQSCALALHLGATVRTKVPKKGVPFNVLTFVTMKGRDFAYGFRMLTEPYMVECTPPIIIHAIGQDIPNYPESLDALFPVEEKLFYKEDGELASQYEKWLCCMYDSSPIHASAAQKLEIILRTINLYDAKTVESD